MARKKVAVQFPYTALERLRGCSEAKTVALARERSSMYVYKFQSTKVLSDFGQARSSGVTRRIKKGEGE